MIQATIEKVWLCLFCLSLLMAVLAQVDQGKLKLDQRVRVKKSDFVLERQHSPIRDEHPQGVELSLAELLKYMISESDGTACDVLLRLAGRPSVVTQFAHQLYRDDRSRLRDHCGG